MIRDMSKITILLATFLLGIIFAISVLGAVGFFVSTSITIREIEEKTAFPIITDKYVGPYPEVYITDMTLMEMIKEANDLANLGDDLTLNLLISRYDLILSPEVDVILTPKVRDLPLNQVFSEDGIDIIMNNVYVGEFRQYEREEKDGEVLWFDPYTDRYITGINGAIANLKLSEVLSGDFSVASVLHDLPLGEALGYELIGDDYYDDGNKLTGIMDVVCHSTIENVPEKLNNLTLAEIFSYQLVDGVYYDDNGNKVKGILSVIADSTVDNIPDKIDNAKLFEILSYEEIDGVFYDENGNKVTGVMSVIADCTVTNVPDRIEESKMGEILGYNYVAEDGTWLDGDGNEVHTLMNTIANNKISELNSLTDNLRIMDIIPEDERQSGYIAMVSPETELKNISAEVNRVFDETSLVSFVDSGVIQFLDEDDNVDVDKTNNFKNSIFADMTIAEMLSYVVDLPTP